MKNKKSTSTQILEDLENPINNGNQLQNDNPEVPQATEGVTQKENPSDELPSQEITDEDIALLLEAGHKPEDLEKESADKLATMVADLKKQGQDTQSFVINEDLANQIGGIAKSFVGKDVTELFKAITEQNSYIGKLQTQIQQLEARLKESSNAKVTNTDKDSSSRGLKLDAEDLEVLVESVLTKKMPQLKLIEEKSQEQIQQEVVSRIKNEINVEDPLPVIREFGSQLTDDEVNYYATNPNKFVRDVVKYHKQKTLEMELEQLRQERRRQANLEVARKVRLALAQKNADSDIASTPVGQSEDKSLKTVQEILGKL